MSVTGSRPVPPNKPDQRFQFLLEQFKLHSKRLGDFQRERLKITTWSTLAIFGYFGWVLTNETAYPILVLWLPVLFVLFGLVYLYALHRIIDRHSGFLDRLENEMFKIGPNTEWNKFKAEGHHGKPLRLTFYTYWLLLLIGTALFSVWLSQATPISTTQEPIERDSNGSSS
jgi:hypothetical protein